MPNSRTCRAVATGGPTGLPVGGPTRLPWAGQRADGRARYACAVADDVSVIVQVPAGSAVDRQLRDDPPPSVTSGRAVTEPVPADAEGRIVPPEGGNVVLSFLSPEALRREPEQVRREVLDAGSDEPPVVVVEVAEELREDELAVVVQAADLAKRVVLLCILLGST
jgi:hypothetical protein